MRPRCRSAELEHPAREARTERSSEHEQEGGHASLQQLVVVTMLPQQFLSVDDACGVGACQRIVAEAAYDREPPVQIVNELDARPVELLVAQ